ncbi:MAG: peptidase T [Deltaproteobacteria bacterium]|nr:peptidase T [Deltaproteobacteria bacterium]MBN2674133.1 peptidase T [Deltaproteobacteria bacterium]
MKYLNNPSLFTSETAAISRFLNYVAFETTSDAASDAWPSTPGQTVLAEHLVEELKELGTENVQIDENGYVLAIKSGTTTGSIALIAHLDTSDAFCGKNVKPQIHTNYDGSEIQLKNGVVISPNENEQLKNCVGHTIITADGTTLLGADDKAGIAIIMGVLEYLQKNPLIPHPTLYICFTPDEEIGRGAERFPLDKVPAEFGVTVDGTFVGELNIETFEAYSIDVTFEGVSVHPGYAKGKMVNALRHMARFIEALPMAQSPESTENKEGFIHPVAVCGDTTKCTVSLIVRDFTSAGAKEKCGAVESLVAKIQNQEPRLKSNVKIEFNYPNMFKYIESHEELVTNIKSAISRANIVPSIVPIRGGTDGANLSKKGLVTPNLFTGAMNLHGPREWVSTTNMGVSFCTLMNLLMNHSDTANRGTNG